jgi:purine catabolism regulator
MPDLTIRDLLHTPHFGLTLLGGEGGLETSLSWVHISEMDDPAPWLDGGELLMANGWHVPRSATGQVEYLRKLHECGAAGLVLGAHAPPLREAMTRTADDLSFPLLRIRREIPFVAVARMVSDHAQTGAQQRLATHVRIFDTLRSLAEGSIGEARLFERLEEIAGFRLYLMSESGSALLPGVAAPDAALAQGVLAPDVVLPKVPGGYAVSVPVAGRTAGYLVAVERDDTPNAGLSAVRHIATIAALQLSRLYAQREWERREGAHILADLLDGSLSRPEIEAVLQRFGFPSVQSLHLAYVGGTRGTDDEWIHHRLADAGVPCLIMRREGRTALLVPGSNDPLGMVAELEHVRVGVSELAHPGSEWPLVRAEAMWALQHAESAGRTRIVHYQPSGWMHWLPPDMPALKSLMSRVLGPLLEYDAAKSSDLLLTLRVYFEHDRQLTAAANHLFVHKGTLAYRLRRIEELTGRKLSNTRDLTEMWLALQAHAVLVEN